MNYTSLGRFTTWDSGSDSFDHTIVLKNLLRLDALIGGPAGASGVPASNAVPWLTMGNLGSDPRSNSDPTYTRTIYSVVESLVENDVPLGTVVAWWRPNSSVVIPHGWVPADGRTIAFGSHSYGAGSITVPDLRNQFVLGASTTNTGDSPGSSTGSNIADGSAGTAADGQANGPGIGGTAGSMVSNLAHTHNFIHTHTVPGLDMDHSHVIDGTDISALPPGLLHGSNNNPIGDSGLGCFLPAEAVVNWDASVGTPGQEVSTLGFTTGSSSTGVPNAKHTHRGFWVTSPPLNSSTSYVNTGSGYTQAGPFNYRFTTDSGTTSAQSGNTTANESPSLASFSRRPGFVGLLYIVKVKKNYNITNESWESLM